MNWVKYFKINSKKHFRKIKNSKEKKMFFVFFLAGAVFNYSFFAYKEFQKQKSIQREIASIIPKNENAVSVSVRDVEKRNIEKVFSIYANLKPIKEMTLNPETKVQVKKVLVTSGQKVIKGQVLVLLDSESIRLKKELSSIEYNLKKSEYELTSALAEKDYVSKNELDQKKLDFKTDEIKQKIEDIEGSSEKLVAPFDGYVADINLKEGDYIDDATKYSIKVIDNSKLKVDLYVPMKIAQKLKKNVSANLVTDEGKKLEAVITNVSPTVDPQTGTVYVEVCSKSETKDWISGVYVEANLYLERKKDVLAVKNQSILYENGKAYAYRVIASADDNVAEKVKLDLGITDGEFVEVKSGLEETDQLVVEGQSELKDQSKIEIFNYQNI